MDLSLREDQIRGIVAHLARLRADHAEVFADPDLVEPNGDFFPDAFTLDKDGIERLLRRTLSYVPIAERIEVALGFIRPESDVSGGGCGSGSCGEGGVKDIARGGAIETEEGYAVLVHAEDVGDPTILTTALARAAGRIVLFEADDAVDPRSEGALSELTALAAGLGLLLLNGACVYKKGCGGMKRHRATVLDVEELALGVALFVRAANKKPRTVRRHLEITQKEAFDAALEWVDERPALLRALVDCPETLADGIFPFEEKKGLFSRLLSRKDADHVRWPAQGDERKVT